MLDDGPGGPNFGSADSCVSLLGEPSATEPRMLQFGGRHLALNATVLGPDLTFSPMLTGGQPLSIAYEGQDVHVTADETAAAQALMGGLSGAQRAQAIRGDEPISLLLGPGEPGTVLAPEGIRGSDLDGAQEALLADVIAAKMETVRAELDDGWFGWWGPLGTLGAAYFPVTGPSVVPEYAPHDMDGNPTDHAHNIYRDPANDYGSAWIGAQ